MNEVPKIPAESDPDVRFTYANERTFLAWNRTALALVATGVAATQSNLALLNAVHEPGLLLQPEVIPFGGTPFRCTVRCGDQMLVRRVEDRGLKVIEGTGQILADKEDVSTG